jgi:hypothetical protein
MLAIGRAFRQLPSDIYAVTAGRDNPHFSISIRCCREVILMRWGMPPPKTGGPSITSIRNTSSPHWRGWLKLENRCLVPFNSFAEYAPEPNPETGSPKAGRACAIAKWSTECNLPENKARFAEAFRFVNWGKHMRFADSPIPALVLLLGPHAIAQTGWSAP